MICNNELIQKIEESKDLIIYGAGVMGKAVKKCLTEAPYGKQIRCFLVQSKESNPESVEGIPVFDMSVNDVSRDYLVIVALHEKHMDGALKQLDSNGFTNVIPLSFDSDLWSDIREKWFCEYFQRQGQGYCNLEKLLSHVNRDCSDIELQGKMNVYVVHSVADRVLKEQVELQSIETPIQVGAALTEEKKFPVRDDEGVNISAKNKQYCELTALYWIWKNEKADYIGISHYRRKFSFNEKDSKKLVFSDADVIVTVPVLNLPNVRQQYSNDHEERDWDIMLEAINILHPKYVAAADKVQNGIYYYAYNMFIARKEILDEYCEWLFSILDYCEKKIGIKEDRYQNRYIGFLAERLLTVFLVHHKDEYKVVIARKHFIETIK